MEHVESRVVLDIDLDILAENYRKIAASVAPLQTVVVLKAGAYGLGMRPVAQALAKAGAGDKFSYVSTAGGAFLEWLEGKELPGVAALKK